MQLLQANSGNEWPVNLMIETRDYRRTLVVTLVVRDRESQFEVTMSYPII